MRKVRILKRILKQTGTGRIMLGFILFFLVISLVVWLVEPEITSYGDAMWYCYAVVTTIGFGDEVAQMGLTRILSVVLSAYAAIVIAIITGVIVNFYMQIVEIRQKETMGAVLDKLERLPDLSPEELREISENVRKLRDQ